jgi:hypothetical protein
MPVMPGGFPPTPRRPEPTATTAVMTTTAQTGNPSILVAVADPTAWLVGITKHRLSSAA